MGRAKKRSLRRLDLRVRMILSTVVVVCFFLLVGGVYVDLFANMAERQVDELSGLLASEMDSQMRRTADILRRTAISLSYSSDVQGALYAPSPLTRMQNLKNVRGTVHNYAELSAGILNILIYQDAHNKITSGDSYLALQTDTLRGLGFEDLRATQEERFTPILTTDGGALCFMYVLPFRNALFPGSAQEESGLCAILYSLRDFVSDELFRRGSVNYLVVTDGKDAHALTPMALLG